MKAVLPALARPLLTPQLPDDLEVAWFADAAEAEAGIAEADIAWVDMHDKAAMRRTIEAAGPRLRWLTTIYAGLDTFPLDFLRGRQIIVTNGAGVNAHAVADYAVLGILAAAKRFDEVVRLRDRHAWPADAPGKLELAGTRALVIGYGTIGRLIGDRLIAFGVEVTGVTRSGRDGTLSPDRWRERLGDYDWVVLAAPSTGDTHAMIGGAEFATMKPTAWLINIARGDMIDKAALIAALDRHVIAGAFLDPTDPEPLPPDDPLWSARNCMITMHLSGRSQTTMFPKAAALFLQNLAAFQAGGAMANVADLDRGY